MKKRIGIPIILVEGELPGNPVEEFPSGGRGRRTGCLAEVPDLVCYLASARASYVGSTAVPIDGGAATRPRA